MDIGKAIKISRIKLSLSQSEFAKKIGCSKSYLSLLESNKRRIDIEMVQKIANLTDCKCSDFISIAESM